MVLILVLVIGLLGALSLFSRDEGSGEYRQKGILVLTLTALITTCLTIVATSKLWFTHLWKKNSTHARHKQHTQNHPVVRNREFRKRR